MYDAQAGQWYLEGGKGERLQSPILLEVEVLVCCVFVVLPGEADSHQELRTTELASASQVPKGKDWIFLVHNESPELSPAGPVGSSRQPLLGLSAV